MTGPAVGEGDRIELVRWGPSDLIDDNETVPPGTLGTVTGYHPGVNQVWVAWDNGSTLALVIDHDSWREAPWRPPPGTGDPSLPGPGPMA